MNKKLLRPLSPGNTMSNMKKHILFCLVALPFMLSAQRMEVGLFSGFANYQGDLTEPPIEIGETSLSFGFFARYNATPKFRVKANLYYGLIAGDDANSTGRFMTRGWSFESKLLETTAQLEFHPIGKDVYGNGGVFHAGVSPYVGLGVGGVFINNEVLVPEGDKSKFPEPEASTVALSLPLVVGVRIDAFEHMSLGIEWGWRATFNDYLDGVGKNGNPDKNDWYVFIGGSLAYVF
jgi:hypothetical protein